MSTETTGNEGGSNSPKKSNSSSRSGKALPVLAGPVPTAERPAQRLFAVGLAGVGVALFALSYFKEWWSFVLYAPQYPKGLALQISLTGMGGDVHEIDLLNHYIGMKHLADAAPFERKMAGFGVAAICLLSLALATFAGRKLTKIIAIPAIAFPVVFLADSFYWLTSFGHDLHPKAPLKIPPFTPQLFGNGKIGQFETFASPSLGFWLAVFGTVFIVAAALVRKKACDTCAGRDECTATCTRGVAK